MFFDQHVGAFWLALLLVRGVPPILRDCTLEEVCFQTEHLGWHTDDFLVVGQDGSGQSRKLAGQVKHTFTVSARDRECKKAVQDFWEDFRKSEPFSQDSDRFALVTLRGTTTLLGDFSGLLACARSSSDGDEFERRLSTEGFISARAVKYCGEVREIVGESEGRSLSVAEVWPFLRVLYVLSLDLNSATGQTEAMIKSLLAYTTGDHDGDGVAEASWNTLLREVGEGTPHARCYRRGDLLDVLGQLHSPVGNTEHQVLAALRNHSSLILEGIHSHIGDLHLPRGRVVQQVLESLESNQVVLISGAAGNGKSVIAKDALGILKADHFTFSFRAEEFARPHLDETLQSVYGPAGAGMVGATLAGQSRKVMLVESLERLLEKETRDAFADLLTLTARDKSWCLLLTCRDYSCALVQSAFLDSVGVTYSVVEVPPLNDGELERVEEAYPLLARPLGNPAVRRVLSNPYFLEKARHIDWSEERPLPQSERDLRRLFWREIVRADHQRGRGMPGRREGVFVEIALRRARGLSLYADCRDLDQDVIDGLRADSLLMASQESPRFLSPAHDVLEDWAILQWIQEQFVGGGESVQGLSRAIGRHPALRRTYRKWVKEQVESEPGIADRLFCGAVQGEGVPGYFADDTMASLLTSSSAAGILERHRSELLRDGNLLFRRVAHILRVASVSTPPWLVASGAGVSAVTVPAGMGWERLLVFAREHLASFGRDDIPILSGLIDDWTRGVSMQNPYPGGAGAVAGIATWILGRLGGYSARDLRMRVLRVIAKIPKADPEQFEALVRGSGGGRTESQIGVELRELIVEQTDGGPAARDLPDLVVSIVKDCVLASDDDSLEERLHGELSELAPLFGLKRAMNLAFLPASSARGPFLALLRSHPGAGLGLVTDLVNHSTSRYVQTREQVDPDGGPWEITFEFADGGTQCQWCDGRLWNLYRGISDGPYVLQSALMGVEQWLLERAESEPEEIEELLLDVLKRSNSGALTGVVASVATAWPDASGGVLLVLLRSRVCMECDRERLGHEVAGSVWSGLVPEMSVADRIYELEREHADARPHRRQDLEWAIVRLQFGPLASQVQEILDQHRADLRPPEEQSESDRLWRLALHRMDLRQYAIRSDLGGSCADGFFSGTGEGYTRLELGAPDPDLREMIEERSPRSEAFNAKLRLLNWGLQAYDGSSDSTQWRDRLGDARTVYMEVGLEPDGLRGGPAVVAAVCVRDHWGAMSDEERLWCVEVSCSEVELMRDDWDETASLQRSRVSADRVCAWVLPCILGRSISEESRTRVKEALVSGLTHPNDEVRWYAARGVGAHLWSIDSQLALRCVDSLVAEASLRQEELGKALATQCLGARRRPAEIRSEVATVVRERFWESNGLLGDADHGPELDRKWGLGLAQILAILVQEASHPAATVSFQRFAHMLVEGWDQDDHPRDMHEAALRGLLAEFLLRAPLADATETVQDIVAAADRHPSEVAGVLRGLIEVEDSEPNTSQFWSLWKLFADRLGCLEWMSSGGDERGVGELVSGIFLGIQWKEDVGHWESLDGHVQHLHSLFQELPPSLGVLDAYVRFLHEIGGQSLPNAFIHIANQVDRGGPQEMLRTGDTILRLEVLLQRFVYGRPVDLKRESELQRAVLRLLELLIENGSSAAFRMRDDFLTPMSVS